MWLKPRRDTKERDALDLANARAELDLKTAQLRQIRRQRISALVKLVIATVIPSILIPAILWYLEHRQQRAEAIRNEALRHTEYQLKLVELAWNDLNAPKEEQRRNAMHHLIPVSRALPGESKDLLIAAISRIAYDTRNSAETRKQAAVAVLEGLSKKGHDYRVGVWYIKAGETSVDKEGEEKAEAAIAALETYSDMEITRTPRWPAPASFPTRPIHKNEIRYSREESIAAHALAEFLELATGTKVGLHLVGESPKYLSVMYLDCMFANPSCIDPES